MMFGGWLRLAQWAREIERKREERAEQRESHKRRRLKSAQAGGQKLRRIKLTVEEKEKLLTRIAERPQKATHSSKMRIVICFYMAIMIFGVMGFALIIFIYEGSTYQQAEAAKGMLSCLIVIAFCVLWLELSNIRKSRSLPAAIPGLILFVLSSAFVGFSVVKLRSKNVITSLLLGVTMLAASYFLCFSKGENAGNQRFR